MRKTIVLFASILALSASGYTAPTWAADASPEMQQILDRLGPLENLVKDQQKTLEAQKKKLATQQQELDVYKKKLAALTSKDSQAITPAPQSKTAAPAQPTAQPVHTAAIAPQQATVQAAEQAPASAPAQTTSITAPPEEEKTRPQINVLPDAGGILTPKGTLMYENSLEYTNTTSNVFTFDGVQVSSVVLVGNISATSARRQVVQDSSRFRMGLTDRLEADVRVPYVYRNDMSTTSQVGGGTTTSRVEGHDIGDVDMGLAYQLNNPREGWPYFIANMRYKSNTGTGPYDINYDANNIAQSLPTGTGFHSAEGSLTVIKVSDPAVLFTNFGYVHNFGADIDKNYNTTRVLSVDPGDAVNFSAGLGFSINQDTSFTLGYKHSYVFGTEQSAMDLGSGRLVDSKTADQNVGALLVGTSYRLTPKTNLNFTVEVGATRDAPDVHLALRLPFEIADFY